MMGEEDATGRVSHFMPPDTTPVRAMSIVETVAMLKKASISAESLS